MLTYHIDHRDSEPKYYYIYKKIKKDILSGNLKEGEKLPSKRSLAEHLGVSLITVENAYQLLKEEGYIEARERSGYFICRIEALAGAENEERQLHMLPMDWEKKDERWQPGAGAIQDFEAEHFQYSLYFKTIRSVISEYGEELRNSIARYLLRYRGVFAQPEQIIIGSGAEHLYGTIVRILGHDKIYGIEDPSYPQIRKVYEGTGAVCEKLKMGPDGIESGLLQETKADILHVTPFHSYPSGVTATIGKRYEYLKWAEAEEKYIVEDDFDSEFFMPGKPVETLFMLDRSQSVIYINTFSKSLSPSIRMGYMILPERLLGRYRERSGGFSCSVPVLEQYALAEFIDRGYFEQHLNRVRRKRSRMAADR